MQCYEKFFFATESPCNNCRKRSPLWQLAGGATGSRSVSLNIAVRAKRDREKPVGLERWKNGGEKMKLRVGSNVAVGGSLS